MGGHPRRSIPRTRRTVIPSFRQPFLPVFGLAALVAWPGGEARAQDVELLGEIHGTRPPPAYYEELRRDPDAFRFQREGNDRLLHIQESLRGRSFHQQLRLQRGPSWSLGPSGSLGPSRSLGPRPEPVIGTFHFPLVLGLFADSPPEPAFSRDRVQTEFFDGPNSRDLTLSEFYHEMSRGLVTIVGTTSDWVQVDLTRDDVTLNSSGLSSSRDRGVAAFIEAIVAELDADGMDWAPFDNTGDGFVDVLTVMHPTHGAECGGGSAQRIWSHRWTVRNASQGRLDPGIATSTPRPDGQGMIHINDYTIQPLLSCEATEINEIGVFAHEMGHGFGLPDLYGTGGSRHTGSGNWDLMGTGSWGCGFGTNPSRPCQMGAWTQAMLGWVEVEELAPDTNHGEISLPPVLSSGRVLRVPAGDGSGEYLLLENRQREGSQTEIFEPGLLVWQIDPVLVDARWGANAVNAEASRMGVRLREADGRTDLQQAGSQRNRGSPGNPFPGCALDDWWDYFREPWECTRNRDFHAGSLPAAVSGAGHALGVAFTGIRLGEGGPADVLFTLSTQFQWDTISVGLELEAAREHEIRFEAEGASEVRWRFLSGDLPPGMELSSESGLLRGATLEMGGFSFVVAGADGIGREVVSHVSLEIVLPDLDPEALLVPFLGGGTGGPSTLVQSFLDRHGNQDGGYDLGDFRAYMQAREAAPPAAASGSSPVRLVVPFPPRE